MRFVLSLFLIAVQIAGISQQGFVEEVINTERAFAAHSVAHGTRAAFLAFMDSTAVVFEKGEIRNGLETWQKKANAPGVLNWRPVYGFASASGDLGFTTGPWMFQPKTIHDSVVARGQYTTIWKKNKEGQWKFVVDMGVDTTPTFTDTTLKRHEKQTSFIKGTWNNLLNREQKFIRETTEATPDARLGQYHRAVSHDQFFLNRAGHLPATNANGLQLAVQTMPAFVSYTIGGSGIAAAGDLGFVYGTTMINGKKDNYLRIWRREGKEWRLALEVLPY